MTLSSRLRAGETLYSAWSTLSDPLLIEHLVRQDFDAVTMDMQHGAHTEQTILQGTGVVRQNNLAAIVRIPVGRFDLASKALDFGAHAVIAPMINNVEDAQKFASSIKYPPIGERSWGPLRSDIGYGQPGSNDYLVSANQRTLSFAMIETRAAYEALDGILGVRGIDGVFVGPSDFSIGWSNGREANPNSEAIAEPLALIASKAASAGKIAGIYAPDAAFAIRYRSLGYHLIALSSDSQYLAAGAQALLKQLK